jgi:hypothetical protein
MNYIFIGPYGGVDMKFSKCGIATSRKIALTTVLVLIIAGGIYLALGQNPSGVAPNSTQATSTSTSTVAASSSGVPAQSNGLIGLFGDFSQMVLVTGYSDFAEGEVQQAATAHFSYAVLGQEVVNSTNYYKVELKNLDGNTSEIAWFNPQGSVDRVDIAGQKNYTGLEASYYAQVFISSFSVIPSISYNTTLLSGLQKTAEGVQGIGPTQMDVITYGLAAPSSTYSNYTLKIATVPGTSHKLAVYLFRELTSNSNDFIEVTSVTRA